MTYQNLLRRNEDGRKIPNQLFTTYLPSKSRKQPSKVSHVLRFFCLVDRMENSGRLGYACLNTILRATKPEPIFCSRTCRKDTIHKNGIDFAKDLGKQNARDLCKLIQVLSTQSIERRHSNSFSSGMRRTISSSFESPPRCFLSPPTANLDTIWSMRKTNSKYESCLHHIFQKPLLTTVISLPGCW